nr:extracellular solute-binding protein [uncultured Lichenicoccus sp.]
MHSMIKVAAASVALTGLVATTQARAADVSVLYAGSLVNLMEHGIGSAFDATGGDRFVGYAGGSNALANQIKGRLRRGDVFISATPKVNDTLMGGANGNWVSWYVTFAKSPLLIAYNPQSRFAAEMKSKPWYEVLREPGIRIGRTDPTLDPKGRLTLLLLQHAEQVYHQPGLAQAVLGAPDNPAQVRPEESLTGRMQSGQIDVGFFYSTEVTDLKLPAIKPAAEVATGASYTVAILRDAADPAGAARYVNFLLGEQGRAVMHQHGLDTVRPALAGDKAAVPALVHLR